MEHHANTTPYRTLGVGEKSIAFVLDTEASLAPVFARIESIEAENTARVLAAFQKEGVAQRHFTPTTGYGYDDIGRDTLDRVFAHSLQGQDALVRPLYQRHPRDLHRPFRLAGTRGIPCCPSPASLMIPWKRPSALPGTSRAL